MGTARADGGAIQAFSGWLGLLEVVSDLVQAGIEPPDKSPPPHR